MVSNIVVVGALKRYTLLHSVWDLNAAQTRLNRAKTPQKQPKTICCVKSEGVVDHSTVTRWLKKFRLGCKNLDAQISRPKTVNSVAVLQALKANPMSSTQRVSLEFGISQSSVVCHHHELGKFDE